MAVLFSNQVIAFIRDLSFSYVSFFSNILDRQTRFELALGLSYEFVTTMLMFWQEEQLVH